MAVASSLTLTLRRLRLYSGLILMAFVASHLINLGLGLQSLASVESWHPVFIGFWQTRFGEGLLALSLLIHTVLSLWSIATRRTLAMHGQDIVQIVLGIFVPALAIGHVLVMRVTGELIADFNPTYGVILSVYWSYAPLLAFQQLFLVVVVWVHGAIGLYSWMVLQTWWKRVGAFILPFLFAVPIVSLLGFVETGKEVLRRLSEDGAFKQAIDQNWDKINQVRPQLEQIHRIILYLYWLSAVIAIAILLARLIVARREIIAVDYDGGAHGSGRRGLSVLEISLASGIPHANVCGGRGRCGTCRVDVKAGATHLSQPDAAELLTLAGVGAPSQVRLACQARVLGPGVRVKRLLPAYADARAARSPTEWLLEPHPARDIAS
jgi:adenylate cyclase